MIYTRTCQLIITILNFKVHLRYLCNNSAIINQILSHQTIMIYRLSEKNNIKQVIFSSPSLSYPIYKKHLNQE